jgi:hypothetical protein
MIKPIHEKTSNLLASTDEDAADALEITTPKRKKTRYTRADAHSSTDFQPATLSDAHSQRSVIRVSQASASTTQTPQPGTSLTQSASSSGSQPLGPRSAPSTTHRGPG